MDSFGGQKTLASDRKEKIRLIKLPDAFQDKLQMPPLASLQVVVRQ